MIELFILEGCGYCRKVLDYLDEHNIPYTKIDISERPNEDMLIKLGGKRQVPFLVDKENKVQMYESNDIINYFKNHII